jgi:L-alanine-DL-glutamate epimerase-like enolase superfamily enzyme
LRADTAVSSVWLGAYTVPTTGFGRAEPESDGTATWNSTSLLVVLVTAGDTTGLGYAYASPAALVVARDILAPLLAGSDALDTGMAFWTMARAVRNIGWAGVAAGAISAVDLALHDLKAKLLGVSAVQLLGGARDHVMAYGSGGFTNYSDADLRAQFAGWAADGFTAVKMKVGTRPAQDVARVAVARDAIGDGVQLFVDANGAYDRKQALGFASAFAELDVSWFEEPVSSDDLAGLRLVRDRAPAGMQVTAGEYGYTPQYFAAMLGAGAVDTIQADATRCGGATGFLNAAAQAQAAGIPLSAHTSPAIHASLASAVPNVVHVEYFHDHAVIEREFFDGLPRLDDGQLSPDRARDGFGLELRASDARRYLVDEWQSD